ncbi:SRPBCC domain-containing protein [Halobacillus sp. A1]|uniref:SRPBCC domain-containing protein n=1 Tax=Halobacillus sp. A1 TaxID=2880262 RepID=UPI0020A66286|nr:SRPBCC domain-containing protein [Halobacillus sp. A1]MCP3032846.1 SRPBCC domain-containing protein [Halobacillus sp. A1]
MSEYGQLFETDGRYALQFERYFPCTPEEVFRVLTDPEAFVQWYPFANGEMDLRAGGEITFDDEEGWTYEGVILKLDEPHTFSFQELDDRIDMHVYEKSEGSRLVFIHTFDRKELANYTAAGWHGSLDVLSQLVRGEPVDRENDDGVELPEIYSERFKD